MNICEENENSEENSSITKSNHSTKQDVCSGMQIKINIFTVALQNNSVVSLPLKHMEHISFFGYELGFHFPLLLLEEDEMDGECSTYGR
jgi:hypothetical protein